MSNIKLPRRQFEKDFGKLDDKMQERIAMFGTTVEGLDDESLEININPNRPDLLSYQGFKRGFLGFLGKKVGLKKYTINPPEKDFRVNIEASTKGIRPFTACAIVKNLKFDDAKIKEIIDMQEKLHFTVGRKRRKLAIGIYPLEKIKLPITLKALEPDQIKFTPLESPREMSGLQILQRHPTGKDYAHLPAGKSKFPIFVDADNNILSMPPIINSHLTGKVTEETKEVFVECSGFDFDILKKCLNIVVTTLAEMDGTVYQMELTGTTKAVTPDLTPEKMKLSVENTNKLLGLNLSEKQIKTNLEKMGLNYDKGVVEIPAWRTDVLHEVDLIEDIAIAQGYDTFIPEIPKISTIGEENKNEVIKRKISEILTGLEFLEVSNYHLTTKEDQFEKMNDKNESEGIEIQNSKTEYNFLRKNLTHYLIKNLAMNVDSEYPHKIFETGRIFENKNVVLEKEKLAIAIAPGNFTEIKQVLEYLERMLNIKFNLEESRDAPEHFIDGRCVKITIEKNEIGYMGEIHPKILKNWKIKMPVALLEIDLENIFERLI